MKCGRASKALGADENTLSFDPGATVAGPYTCNRITIWRAIMAQQGKRQLVVFVTKGTDNELSSVGFTIANGGLTAGLDVSIFLTSAGVDLVRRRSADSTQVHPLESLKAMIDDFLRRGGKLWACTPCVKARGYEQADLVDGVVISGASVVHDQIKAGAATISF